jgi:hypothetical protein
MKLTNHVLFSSLWLTAPALAVLVGLLATARYSPADSAAALASDETPAATESESEDDEDGGAMLDPLGPNAACYVCHTTFVYEELARTHLAEKVTCIECHGLSAAHANDEDIGATKPDIMYKRHQIDASCEKCHDVHDVSAQDVVARYMERELKEPKPVCTDCHGMHRIEHADDAEEPEGEPKPID